jgi:hypothetical protein
MDGGSVGLHGMLPSPFEDSQGVGEPLKRLLIVLFSD